MQQSDFWKLLDGYPLEKAESIRVEYLVRTVGRLAPDTLIDILRIYLALHEAAKREEIWAASIILHQGACDDLCFDYFRNFLIFGGRGIYDMAMAAPDDLAEVPLISGGTLNRFHDRELKEALSASYFMATERSLFRDFVEYTDERFLENLSTGLWLPPGRSELQTKYPRLCARFTNESVAPCETDPYEVNEVFVKGLGKVSKGRNITHRSFGTGRIVKIIRYPGDIVRGNVYFKDSLRQLSFDDPTFYSLTSQ